MKHQTYFNIYLFIYLFVFSEHFDFLVQMLYNVVYVQALAVMSCKFTSEEREAWRKKGQKVRPVVQRNVNCVEEGGAFMAL